ncbi:MAG: hypothetical protein HOL85_00255 [Rhodospirillaceae bacterium]|nr:hypothetical protein [Rhodospirillaceae bacterium]
MAYNRLYRVNSDWWLENENSWHPLEAADVARFMAGTQSASDLVASAGVSSAAPSTDQLDAPLLDQELWGAGVTYQRSQAALIGESTTASVYDAVYSAPRPQTFFKGAPGKAVGHGGVIGVRGDSHWTAPETELCIVMDPAGRIIGYTLANDVTARDVEAVNPLYQPQSKVYRGSCSVGPCLVLAGEGVDPLSWSVSLRLIRGSECFYEGNAEFSSLNRTLEELAATLYAFNDLPGGAIICTGTDIIPPDTAGLEDGDIVEMHCAEIGTLTTPVKRWS